MQKILSLLMIVGSLSAAAECFHFSDLEDTELVSQVELCYETQKTNLQSLKITYRDGRQLAVSSDFIFRSSGSEEQGTLTHGIDHADFWMMVEWRVDSITVFDEQAQVGSFLDMDL